MDGIDPSIDFPDLDFFVAQVREQQAESLARQEELTASSSPGGPSNSEPNDGSPHHGTVRDRDTFEGPDSPLPLVGALFAPAMFTLEQARVLKRSKTLSAESDAEADRYMKTINPLEHAFLSYLVALQNRDLLMNLSREATSRYKIPDTVKKTAQDYAQLTIMSPSLSAYRNAELPRTVLKSMRDLSVADLPLSSETGRCDLLLMCIAKALTDWRCHVKTCILKALNENDKENLQDIATLTRACIGSSKARPTAALYIRIAWLRYQFRAFLHSQKTVTAAKKEDSEKFWVAVDKDLAKWRVTFKTSIELESAFQANYEEDKKRFGNPDATKATAKTSDLETWLVTINKNSANMLTG